MEIRKDRQKGTKRRKRDRKRMLWERNKKERIEKKRARR